MKLISEKELREYLQSVPDGFKSVVTGIEIQLKDKKRRGVKGELSVIAPIDEGKEGRIIIDLIAEFETVEAFIKEADIKSIDDLQNITPAFCNVQYVQDRGHYSCFIEELGRVYICFKVVKGLTIVYSVDLNYYDELKKALTMPEQLVGYIEKRMERLGTYGTLANLDVEI